MSTSCERHSVLLSNYLCLTHFRIVEGTSHASADRRQARAKAGGAHVFPLSSFMHVAATGNALKHKHSLFESSLVSDATCVIFYHLRDIHSQGCLSCHLRFAYRHRSLVERVKRCSTLSVKGLPITLNLNRFAHVLHPDQGDQSGELSTIEFCCGEADFSVRDTGMRSTDWHSHGLWEWPLLLSHSHSRTRHSHNDPNDKRCRVLRSHGGSTLQVMFWQRACVWMSRRCSGRQRCHGIGIAS